MDSNPRLSKSCFLAWALLSLQGFASLRLIALSLLVASALGNLAELTIKRDQGHLRPQRVYFSSVQNRFMQQGRKKTNRCWSKRTT